MRSIQSKHKNKNTSKMSYASNTHAKAKQTNVLPGRKHIIQITERLNYRPLSRLGMDHKVMPKSYKGHKLNFCIIDEVTNYLITVPIHHPRSEELDDTLIDNIISKFSISDYMIMDVDNAFMYSLMNYSRNYVKK